jgi:O-antigen ligase
MKHKSSVPLSNFFNILFNSERLIYLNLILLFFFTVFGTALPWQEKATDYYEHNQTNFVNQLLYPFLFLSSVLAIIPIRNRVFQFVLKEKFFAIFLLWCILSAVWSDYSMTSLIRSFQFMVIYLVLLLSVYDLDQLDIVKIIKVIISIYIIVTIFSVIFIPEAIDPKFNTWRGIHNNKNGLSQMGLLSFLLTLTFYNRNSKLRKNLWNFTLSLLSVLIIFMSGSSTIIIILFIIFLIYLFYKFENIFSKLRLGWFFELITFIFFIALLVIFFLFSSEVLSFVPEMFGKDMTFTGRVLFWKYLLMQIQSHPLFGFGFGSYWILGSPHVTLFFDEAGTVMNTAHNGFIDLTLQVGMIGLVIFFVVIGIFFYRAIKINYNTSILLLISIIIGNFTESTLQGKSITMVIFILFYLISSKVYFDRKYFSD